jgi:predicted 2-oxoglutarate/Fe(II)-dependent dioxygenase YbiX
MPKEEDRVVKPVPQKRRKQSFMWTRSKQRKRREEMARTRKRNFNLPHQEEIDKEVTSILSILKFFPNH